MRPSPDYVEIEGDIKKEKYIELEEELKQSYHSGIIYFFRKTPPSIVCPHFWELRWAWGCPFNCAYCYLQGTFRGNKQPRYKSLTRVLFALQKAFNDRPKPTIFNSGELADSLMNPILMEQIADKFEEQNKHKLLILTKSTNIKFLLKKPRKQTIISFSINAPKPASLWEKGAPSPAERIEAAKAVSKVGYEVRIRIDPIFPIENWQSQYGELVDSIFSQLMPERITLGTPRGLRKTLLFSKNLSWAGYLAEDSGWGKKVLNEVRKEIYFFLYNKLCNLGFEKSKISLCKETVMMWGALNINPGSYLNWEKCRCNCVW